MEMRTRICDFGALLLSISEEEELEPIKQSVSRQQGLPSAHPISSHLYQVRAEAEEHRKKGDAPIGGVHFGVFVAVRDWSTRGISKLLTVIVVVHCEFCVKTSGLSELHTYKKAGAKRLFTFHRG
jgi:hypothetical protein